MTMRNFAGLAVAGALAILSAPGVGLAQPVHGCAETLISNADYRQFNRGLDRVRSLGILRQSEPVTIFALNNAAVSEIPPALRNLFLPPGPEESVSNQVMMVVDQFVVQGIHPAAELRAGKELYTTSDATVQVVGARDGKPLLRVAGYDLVVVAPDMPCRNGLIQGVAFVPRGR